MITENRNKNPGLTLYIFVSPNLLKANHKKSSEVVEFRYVGEHLYYATGISIIHFNTMYTAII